MNQKIWTWVSPAQVLPINFWISGVPASTNYHTLVLPSWLPNPLLITRARIAHQNQFSRPGGQIAIDIDVGHTTYNSGTPPYYQDGDTSQTVTLASIWLCPYEPQERTEIFSPPISFDATKDGLWLQFDGAQTIDQFFFQIGFLVP